MMKKKIIFIGAAGKQSQEYIELLKSEVEIVALIDPLFATESGKIAKSIPCFGSIDKIPHDFQIDFAFISVPHNLHYDLTKQCLLRGWNVVKEKPFSLSVQEAHSLLRISELQGKKIWTICQRNWLPQWKLAKEWTSYIGKIYSFEYEYSFNFSTPTSGWRSKQQDACGGVLIDMGYHSIDLIQILFGVPDEVFSTASFCYQESMKENLEDSVSIMFQYNEEKLKGTLQIDRHNLEKKECLSVQGSNGFLVITLNQIQLYNKKGTLIGTHMSPITTQQCKKEMLLSYLDGSIDYHQHIHQHLSNVQTINTIYNQCLQKKKGINYETNSISL